MVAVASDHHRLLPPKTSISRPSSTPQPMPPPPAPPARAALHSFTFSDLNWGTRRLLRCSKNPASTPSPPIPPPQTTLPDKKTPPRAAAGAAQPQPPPRPRELRARRAGTAAAPQARWEAAMAAKAGQKKRPAFSAALSTKEIEEDFLAVRGVRPPRRPKKRPRAVQQQLQRLYPGKWPAL